MYTLTKFGMLNIRNLNYIDIRIATTNVLKLKKSLYIVKGKCNCQVQDN